MSRKCRRCSLRYSGPLPTCASCRFKLADRQREYYHELRALGLCTDCKRPSAGRARCEPCSIYNRNRCRSRRLMQQRSSEAA